MNTLNELSKIIKDEISSKVFNNIHRKLNVFIIFLLYEGYVDNLDYIKYNITHQKYELYLKNKLVYSLKYKLNNFQINVSINIDPEIEPKFSKFLFDNEGLRKDYLGKEENNV